MERERERVCVCVCVCVEVLQSTTVIVVANRAFGVHYVHLLPGWGVSVCVCLVPQYL